MHKQPETRTEGSNWSFKETGLSKARLFKQRHYFYVVNNAKTGSNRNIRVWGLYTNDLQIAQKWYRNPTAAWNKKGAASMYIKVGKFAQLVHS